MKTIISLFTIILLFYSCGKNQQSIDDILETKDIKTIQEKKDQLAAEQQELSATIKRLDDTLKNLNPERNMPLVTQFNVDSKDFSHFIEFQGSVETKQNLMISPEMSGILERVYVKEGDRVKKGQILAKIDDGGLSQQLAQLNIQKDLAKTTFERQKRLWQQNIGSEIQYLNAKTSYEALIENVNQVKKQLSKTNITASFDGIIDDVITEQGNVVGAGATPVFRLINLSNMYITVDVPETFLPTIKEGSIVEINLPVINKKVKSKVRQTGSFINPANRTFKVEIDVPNAEEIIKPNITARVNINDYNSKDAILIPQNIISENADGDQYVYQIIPDNDNKAKVKQVIVKTGKTQGDFIEIITGLTSEMKLVSEGARTVKDGQFVKVLSGV